MLLTEEFWEEWMKTKILAVRQGKVINPVSELHAKDVRIAELQDALEFSERVVARLARMMLFPNKYPCRGGSPQLGCMRDLSNLTGPMAVHCEDCILREVRLQVEDEMDGQTDA